jgi:toxin ParE1/3/4
MKKYEVSFRPLAEADLLRLYEDIAEASDLALAGGYIDRLEAACLALETFPERGTRRDDIRPGLRVMGFERRATIIFQVTEGEVGDCPDILRWLGLRSCTARWWHRITGSMRRCGATPSPLRRGL